MIRFNSRTGQWSDERPRFCSFMSSMMMMGGSGSSAAPTFTLDGTGQDNVSSSSFGYTVVGTIPVGSVVVVCGASLSATTSGELKSAVDSKGNTYAKDISDNGSQTNGFPASGIASSTLTTQLVAGDTIAVTFNASKTGHGVIVGYITNAGPSPKDANTHNNGTGTSPSGTTGALAMSNEIAVGFISAHTASAFTEDATFTNAASLTYAGATYRLSVGTKLVSSAATYAPTIPSSNYVIIVQTYKGT